MTDGGRLAILGAGAWGTTLAIRAASRGRAVGLWVREPDLLDRIRSRRDNPMYLPGVAIPPGVEAAGEPESVLAGAEAVILAVPTPFARSLYRRIAPLLPPAVPAVSAAKGIEEETLRLPLEVVADELGEDRPAAVLSGPSFAAEVARGLPTAVVVASAWPRLAAAIQDALSGPALRLYTNEDPVGVQVAGALKNVIALAAGVVDGLGMGYNTRAALITRGLSEIRRLGVALGGRPDTFSGLAGLGDLVLTCTGDLSRNRRVGLALGRGERLQDALAHRPGVAEGVRTARSARDLARRAGIEMPIVEETARILFEDADPRDALVRLMARPLTSEERPA